MTQLFRTAVGRMACLLSMLLAGCGGGTEPMPLTANPTISQFTSDKPDYFVGERAQLSAVYDGGTGRIQPGNIAISSGQRITTPALPATTTFHLVVEGNGNSVTRDLALNVRYRERTRVIEMPFGRAEHAAVTLSDGRVLIVGGVEGGLPPRTTYIFDPSSETFTPSGSLIAGRIGFVAVALPDDKVLVVGGISATPDSVLIDARSGAVTATNGAAHSVRFDATGTLLPNGKVLIVGGVDQPGPALDQTAETYDPATGAFTLLPMSLSVPRYRHAAVATSDGRVLIYGGLTNGGQPPPPELYDPATGAFAALAAPESIVRVNHAAVRTSDGALWIVGGDDNTTALTTIMRFDAASATMSRALDLATPRTYLAAAALNDGRFLVAGGAIDVGPQNATDTSELIVTATALAGAGPTMSRPRFSHTMTLLSNGKVLIVGGEDVSDNALASAEIFE